MPMQEPQEFEGEDGTIYVREGNRYRVIRPGGQAAAPAAPQSIPGLIPMTSPSEARAQRSEQRQEAQFDWQREAEGRRLAMAEQAAGLRGDSYRRKFEERRASADADRFADAQDGLIDAGGLEAAGRRAERLLEDRAPVGAFADQRIAAGRMAGDFLGFLPGIPNRRETEQLEQLRLLGSQGALGDVSQLKGPLSEKELAFIQRLQIDPNATRETNLQVARVMQWAARRQAAYGSAMQRWTDELGSPRARNRDGLSFNAWWGQYAAESLPQPGMEPVSRQSAPVDAVPAGSSLPAAGPGDGPQPGDVRVTQQPLAPEDTPNRLSAQGYVYNPQRDIWERSREEQVPTPGAGGGGLFGDRRAEGGLAGLITGQQQGPDLSISQDAIEARRGRGPAMYRPLVDGYRRLESYALGASEQIPGLDEAAAWTAGKLTGTSFEDARNVQRQVADYDRENYRTERNLGGISGALAPMAVAAPLATGANIARAAVNAPRIERLGRFTARTGRAAGIGAGTAGIYAAGAADGGADERIEAGTNALGIGAVAGAAAPYLPAVARFADDLTGNVASRTGRAVGEFAGRQAGRAGNALGIPGSQGLVERSTPHALTPLADRLVDRLGPERITALRPRADTFSAEGIDPTFVDALDDGGRGLVRAAASRQTPGRDAVREFSDGRAAGLQDRLSAQARRTISNDPRQPREMRDEFVTRARERAAPLYEEAYARPGAPRSPLTDELMERPSMREAMGRAVRIAREEGRDPNTLGFQFDADGNVLHVREPSMQTMDYLKRGLDDHLESFRDAVTGRLNLDTAGRAAQQTRVAFRRELERLNPTYGEALAAYGDEAQLGDAVRIGEQFLTMEADDFATAIARLSPEQRQIAQAAARRAVERQAGTQGAAPGVAQRLTNGREQAARTDALMGDAEPVQRAMGAELQALRNARDVDPRGGSQSSLNLQDAGNLAGMGEIARDAQTIVRRPFTGPIEVLVNRYTTRGFSNAEAEQLARLAVDPSRTPEFIDLLSERMTRREARRLARTSRHQALATTQSGQQSPE